MAGRIDDLPDGRRLEGTQLSTSPTSSSGARTGSCAGSSTPVGIAATRSAKAQRHAKRDFSVSTICGPTASTATQGLLRGDLRRPSTRPSTRCEVPVDSFAGFIFLNPDPDAGPLAECLGRGRDGSSRLTTSRRWFHGDECPESLDCNWKVVMDAFNEGYHINRRPSRAAAVSYPAGDSRYGFFERPQRRLAPFEVVGDSDPSSRSRGSANSPETFPGAAAVLPRFEELVDDTADDGKLGRSREGVTARSSADGDPRRSDRDGLGCRAG